MTTLTLSNKERLMLIAVPMDAYGFSVTDVPKIKVYYMTQGYEHTLELADPLSRTPEILGTYIPKENRIDFKVSDYLSHWGYSEEWLNEFLLYTLQSETEKHFKELPEKILILKIK